MRLLSAFLLVAVALAGCSDATEPIDNVEPVPTGSASAGNGVIRGVIVDSQIIPVAGATVTDETAGSTVETDAEGIFIFDDVEPGIHFLSIGKPGWSEVQHSVDVIADEEAPPITRIQIERIPGTEPRAETRTQSGLVACGAATALTIHSICNDAQITDDRSHVYFEIPEKPDYYQAEIMWRSTQAVATSMWTAHYQYDFESESYIDGGGPASRLCNFAGESPIVCRRGPDELADRQIGGNVGVDIAMFADGPEGNGVAIDQSFDVYLTLFYNTGEPDPAWTYIEHGDYAAYAGLD